MSTSAELSPSQSHNRRPRPLLRSIVEAEVVGQGANTAGLALLVWGVASQTSDSRHATHFAAYLLLAVASAGWVSWFALRTTSHTRLALAGALVMAAAGSAIVPYASLALVFMAVPALGAGANLTPKPGAAVLVAAWVALTTSVVVLGGSTAALGDGLAASMAGLAMGMARRQSLERARAAAAMEAAMEVEKAHTEVERARAEILAERNRLAREIHDVLAHTLAALSVQLEALSAVADTEGAPAPVVAQLDQTRQLVREGLEEARGAVRALRDDVPALVDQLGALCAQWGAKLAVTGQPRAIPADASVALYRVAQEAFTNAAKHAPGAVVRVDVSFEPRSVGLSVHNSVSLAEERPLSNTGGGFGLQGIRERVMLVGGAVDAGPAAGGWRVQARVPA